MASLVISDYRRPCWCRNKKAMFHCWTRCVSNGEINGIVEFENGAVELVGPEEIIFADGGQFNEYMFRYELD